MYDAHKNTTNNTAKMILNDWRLHDYNNASSQNATLQTTIKRTEDEREALIETT